MSAGLQFYYHRLLAWLVVTVCEASAFALMTAIKDLFAVFEAIDCSLQLVTLEFEDVTAWRHGLFNISKAWLLTNRAIETFVGAGMKTRLRPLAWLYTLYTVVASGVSLCFIVRMAH